MRKIELLFVVLLLGAILFACAPKVAPVAPVEEKLAEAAIPVAKEGWETRWEKTLRAAQQEARVVIWGGSVAAELKHAIGPVREKYGINLDVTFTRGGEIRARIVAQRAAGLYIPDILLSGSTILFQFKEAKLLDPVEPWLILPEVIDPGSWYEGKFPWGDKEKRYAFNLASIPSPVLAVNTSLVQPGGITSYYDLLKPEWKGKIIINDPTTEGTGIVGFETMLYNKIVDLGFFHSLVAHQPILIRDQRLQIDWLAKGKYPVLLWPLVTTLGEFMEAGAPVAPLFDVKEGTYAGSSGSFSGLMNRASHPNAAAIFINWLLSREGSTLLQNASLKHSTRIDIPSEGIHPTMLRKPDVKYWPKPADIEEYIINEERDRYMELARQVFAPLLK